MNSTGEWKTQPEAEKLVERLMTEAYSLNPEAKEFSDRLVKGVAVRMRDLLDSLSFNDSTLIPEIESLGWVLGKDNVYTNSLGWFPALIFEPSQVLKVCFRVEFVEDFIQANEISTTIEGKRGSQFRMGIVFSGQGHEFWAIERHGTMAYSPIDTDDKLIAKAQQHQQSLILRKRNFKNVIDGFDYMDGLIQDIVGDIGADWACDLFLRAEREYWMTRNTAGRIQKDRQDAFGIGWANQDHHTFDSSREHFYRTINILEQLGFECRELFYAGAGAGWGSQILEQPSLKSVIFADIDLAPEELDFDFAHDQGIKPLYPLRRAGLWCAMHGESMFEAGLNHLECMYDAKVFNELFAELDIPMMEPFSDFPHLYQALTVGEWWEVDHSRIEELQAAGHITSEAADNFKKHGAIGSHFENLERNDGFKGFNQPGIDDVLRVIDPRKQLLDQ